jgi:protein ImuB
MSRRWLSIWFPKWSIERMAAVARRRGEAFPNDAALALVAFDKGVPRLARINDAAAVAGLRVGLTLTDARAILPSLEIRESALRADEEALQAMAAWCERWSPRVAPDGPTDATGAGIALDITGCAHLFGGESRLLAEIETRFQKLGFTTRLAIAERLLAAWAWARFGKGGILAGPQSSALLGDLPIEALRIAPETAMSLRRLGFQKIAQLMPLPRSTLLARFGEELPARLAQLTGAGEAPFVPLRLPHRFVTRMSFPEPIGRTEDISAAIRRLLWQLRIDLERASLGARRLQLLLHRIDGTIARRDVRLGRPSRDASHLAKLFDARLDNLDIGFGIELVRVEVEETEPLEAEQAGLTDETDERELARLADRLILRLGPDRVVRLVPFESHIPERAARTVPATASPSGPPRPPNPWLARVLRPLRLHDHPLPLEVMAALPEGPPARFGRHRPERRVTRASGPERILPEWWRPADTLARGRDYYRITDEAGQTFWVFREGSYGDPEPPRWRLHGSFD